MAVEIAFIIALSITLTDASSSSFLIDAASNPNNRLSSFALPKMIPLSVFAPLYVSRKDRYSRTIFNRSPDSSSISNNNGRWETMPFSAGKPRGDDDYGNDRRMSPPDAPRGRRMNGDDTTMTTSPATSRDYDLYDMQMREDQRDYREGKMNQRQDYYTDDNFEDSRRFDDRDDNYSNVNDEYFNNRPYYDRNDRYDFDMRQQQQEPHYDDDYEQMRKSSYHRRIPKPPLPLSQLIRRKNESSQSSSRIVGELYTDNFRRGGSNSENFRRGPIRDRGGREYDVDLDDEEDYYDYTSYNGRGDADNSRSSSYDRWDQRGQQSDRATSFRGSRWQDTDDFMRTDDSRSPGQLVNSGREIAFNRSRSGLIGDSSSKKNLNRWQRGDALSSSLILSPAFSVGRRGVEETDFRRRGERQQQKKYGRDIAFDHNRPQQYGTNDLSIDDNYYKGRQNQLFETKSTTFGQIRRVPTPPSQSRQQQQNDLNRLQMDNDNDAIRKDQLQQQQSDTVQQQRRHKNDRLVTTRQDKKPLVKQMMDGFTDLFTDKTSTSSSVSNRSEEERVTRVLLSDARRCLLADPGIRDILGGGGGEKIKLGKISSRSYTSTMVNGQTRSRVQLTFPINVSNSSRYSSQGTLIANQDGITRLQVDVDGITYAILHK